MIPPASQIVDSSRNVWTLSGGVVLEQGSAAGYSANVTELLYQNGVIYQENSAGNWWSWTNGAWVSASNPLTVASSSPTPAPSFSNGYDGVISVNSAGLMVNGAGVPIELRGSNMPMDSQIMGSWPNQPFGGYAGAGGPPWATYATWKPNVMRITVNTGAWLNVNMGVFTSSSTPSAPSWMANCNPTSSSSSVIPISGCVAGDPALTYKAAILSMIKAARSIGAYVIINAHWSAPAFTFNGVRNFMGSYGQPLFLDYDMGLPYWTAGVRAGPTDATGNPSTGIVAWLMENAKNPATGNINDIIFELFNEPFLDGQTVNANTAPGGTGTPLTNEQVMLNGGWVSGYSNQYIGTGRGGVGCPNNLDGPSGQPGTTSDAYTFNYWWRAAGT
jgi:hypothetical protein